MHAQHRHTHRAPFKVLHPQARTAPRTRCLSDDRHKRAHTRTHGASPWGHRQACETRAHSCSHGAVHQESGPLSHWCACGV